jgi:hypothetical protein
MLKGICSIELPQAATIQTLVLWLTVPRTHVAAAKVKSDYALLSEFSTRLSQAKKQFDGLQLAHDQLAAQLSEADCERKDLQLAFDKRAKVLADLEARFQQSCELAKDLQQRLDEAAAAAEAATSNFQSAKAQLEKEVGAGLGGWWQLGAASVLAGFHTTFIRCCPGGSLKSSTQVSTHVRFPMQTKLHAEAERAAAALAAELAQAKEERNDLAKRLGESATQVDKLLLEATSWQTAKTPRYAWFHAACSQQAAKLSGLFLDQACNLLCVGACLLSLYSFRAHTLLDSLLCQAALEAQLIERQAEVEKLASDLANLQAAATSAQVLIHPPSQQTLLELCSKLRKYT